MTKSCWCSCSFEMGKTKLTLRHCPWFQTKPIVVVIVIETLQSALKRSSHYLLFQKLYFYHSNHRDHLLRSRLSRTPQGHHKSPIFARLFISRFIYWIELKHLDIPEKTETEPYEVERGYLDELAEEEPFDDSLEGEETREYIEELGLESEESRLQNGDCVINFMLLEVDQYKLEFRNNDKHREGIKERRIVKIIPSSSSQHLNMQVIEV